MKVFTVTNMENVKTQAEHKTDGQDLGTDCKDLIKRSAIQFSSNSFRSKHAFQ